MNKQKTVIVSIIFLAFAGSYAGRKLLIKPRSKANVSVHGKYKRIVSLAPSITEMLFALGLGGRIVGVTEYCDYPDEALNIAKIGGYYNPNYEAIVALKPDLIVMLPGHKKPKKYLTKLGLDNLVVKNESIPGILESILDIGKKCDAEEKAVQIVNDIKKRISKIKNKTKNLPHPRVMISVGRNMGSNNLQGVYIACNDGFYSSMVTLAGGVNACNDGMARFPSISKEGIIRLNPEIIIDMIPDLKRNGWKEKSVLKAWESLRVDAVKNKRVYVFGEGYTVIPGPRFVLIVEEIAQAIRQERK